MNEKLEELLKNNNDLQKELNNISHSYPENLTEEIVNSLVRIKSSTKEDEIVRIAKSFYYDEVLNLLTKYSNNTSNRLIESFIKIAKYSNRVDVLKALSSEFLNSNYSEKGIEKIAFSVGEIAEKVKEDNTLLDIISTIFKYKGPVAENVALGFTVFSLFPKEDIYNLVDIMNDEHMIKFISKYSGGNLGEFGSVINIMNIGIISNKEIVLKLLNWIEKFDNYSLDFYFSKERIDKLIELMSDESIIKHLSKYSGRNLRKIIGSVINIGLINDKETVLKLLNSIKNYDGNTAGEISYCLEGMAERIGGGKGAIIETLNTINKYSEKFNHNVIKRLVYTLSSIAFSDPENISSNSQSIEFAARALRLDEVLNAIKKQRGATQQTVMSTLAQISKYAFDEELIRKVVNTLNKYKEPEVVEDISVFLYSLSTYFHEANIASIACNLIEKAGVGALKILNAKDVEKIRKENLENIIESKEDLDVVIMYLRSGGELPPLTKDNIKAYNRIILDYLNKTYGLNINSLVDAQKFLSSPREKREKLAHMIKNSRRTSQKLYSLVNNEISPISVENVNKLYNSLVISIIGSKDQNKEKEALEYLSKIVDRKIINQARIEFNSKYKNKLKEIIPLMKNGEFEKVIELLRSLDNDKINSVIYYANKENILKSNLILESVVTKNPLEYDSREQIACVYLPRSDKILDYCEDDRFVLIKYSLGGKTLGSAICYIENGNFLVDSVEGNRGLRKEKLLEIVYKDLIERAKESGCKRILFNKQVMNLTPKEFVKFLSKKVGLKEINLRMGFYEVKEGILESKDIQDKNPLHVFKGYLLNLY